MNSDPYRALGVRPFINCCGVRTLHGGSLLSDPVRAAMAAAAGQFVDMDELMEAAGARIGELTGAEWGLVTCGSAAALALGTAACVAGNDPIRMHRLPFTEGPGFGEALANRVLMPAGQRFAYDTAIRMVGTHIVEFADLAELERLLDGRVAMVAVLGKDEAQAAVRLEAIKARTKALDVPIMVDAASEHLARPDPWLARGADLVVYSGGKFLRGPQTGGLLLGRKALVQAAWRHAAPHHAFGRPMKVSKEDVVGVVAALEDWFETRDAAAEAAGWEAALDEIAAMVSGMQGVRCVRVAPEGTVRVPRLTVRWDPAVCAMGGVAMRQRLLDGTPRVRLDDRWAADNVAGGHEVGIDPFNLTPGEAAVVGRVLAAAIGDGGTAKVAAAAGVEVGGVWTVRVRFLRGERVHRLVLRQTGSALEGEQASAGFAGAVSGRVEGARVLLRFSARIEGTVIVYGFDGMVAGDGMGGTVGFGCANDSNDGVVNRRQYGSGVWEAVRVAA